ncbi:TonB-dependent receptor [Qipengyuania oceanensis]|nr:TonB-dependent receptor [Qipengyuania oceanensis]
MKQSAFGIRHLREALLGTAAVIGIAAIPSTAAAQDAAGDAGTPDSATAAQPVGNEIIVLARRQAETLQEVPVTITSVSSETLDKYNVDQVADVVSRVPTLNVQVGGSGSGGQLSLRGVGSSAISAAFDSAVAFDFDGVQVSTMRMVQAGFFDVQQIDVLKGPQSLFFGKSASAGVFSIRSADPTPNWSAGGKASYEFEEKGWTVGGFVSGPITDTLGIRLAGQWNKIDEFTKLQPDTPATNLVRGQKNVVARATLAWEPVVGFDANLKVQYVKNTNDGAIGNDDIYCGPNGIADPVYLLQGGLVYPGGYDCNDHDGLYYLPDTAPPLAQSVPLATGPTLAQGFNGVPFGETEMWFGRLALNFGITDNVNIVSTTGFLDLDATDVDNYSYGGTLAPGIPGGAGTSDPRNTLKQYSQEIRLETDNDGPFNVMFGAFYEWRKFLFDTSQQGVNISFVAPDPITGYTFDWDKAQSTKTEATSLFGSIIFDVTDRLEISGGVRWTDEKKTSRISVPYVHAFLSATPAFISSGFFSGPIEFSDKNWSPEATIKYEINPDVNVFASFKTGFKSGGIDNSALPSNSLLGFNDPDPAVRQAVADGLKYQSETAIGGEVGVKSQFSNRDVTLNVTAYYYVFDDLQVQNFNAQTVQFITLNAGEVTTKGVDIGWGWETPVEGLSLSGNIAWLDGKFTKSFPVGEGIDLEGRDVARAPEWSGNIAADWSIPLGDTLELGLSGNAIYSDSYYAGNTLYEYIQDSYVAFDASASIGHPDGLWKLSLIGVNLTDKLWTNTASGRPFLEPGVGDDLILTQNRGRQIFVEGSFKF